MFTAAAIMKLYEDGKLSLDDKASKFFPELKHGDKISIHHMLTERTGIPRIGDRDGVNYTRLTESAQTFDDLIRYFSNQDLDFEPGSRYRHTRSSYILLGRIIEKASGKRFGEYLEKKIFKPLGMKNTGHFGYEMKLADLPNLATGYAQSGVTDLELAQRIHWSSKSGHASIFSSAEDLGKFAEAALNAKLLSAASWKKILSAHDGDGVGYGWFISPQGNHRRFHSSGGAPGFSSFISVFPDEKLTIVMLSSIQIGVPYFTVPKLASIVFKEPYEKLDLITPPNVERKVTEKLVGTFQFGQEFYRPNGTVSITAEGDRLFSDGAPLIPINEGEGSPRKFLNRRFWSTLEFVFDDKGKVIGLRFDRHTGRKLEAVPDQR